MSLALRAAIALHPAAWREKHADAVLGTLMDVADERGGRVPVAETLNLALRGLWLRFRGSVTFWACLVIVVVTIVTATSSQLYQLDGSLTDHLLKLNSALAVVLPVLSVVGGWNGARARMRRIDGWRGRLRRLAVESTPPLIVTAIAFVIGFAIVCMRFGVPWVAWPAGLVLGAQAAMVAGALAVGEVLGAVLPRVLVIFVAPAAIVTLMVRSPAAAYGSLAYVFDPAPMSHLSISMGMVVVLAVVIVATRTQWVKALPALAFVAATLVVALVIPVASGWARAVQRSRAELVCSNEPPAVCLWPEQDAAFGDSLRRELSDARDTGLALGLPMDGPAPTSVARFAMTGIPAPEQTDWDDLSVITRQFGLGVGGVAPRDIVAFYAFSVSAGYGEAPVDETEVQALQFAIGIVLGVDRDQAWPPETDSYTGQPIFSHSMVPDEAAARALVDRWLTVGLDGVRAPS